MILGVILVATGLVLLCVGCLWHLGVRWPPRLP